MMNCLHPVPLTVQKNNGRVVKVLAPCGHCEACLIKRKMQWVFRLNNELKVSSSAFFVTMTYDEDNVPYYYRKLYDGPKYRKPFAKWFRCHQDDALGNKYIVRGVSKEDVQCYFKRLRKAVYPFKFKYFLVSEYGPQTYRPHYHFILFNFPRLYNMFDIMYNCWSKCVPYEFTISEVIPARIGYVAKYSLNNLNSKDRGLDRPRNFLLCSKGIGLSYSQDPAVIEYHHRNNDTCIRMGKRIIPLTRYDKEKIFTYDELDAISIENEQRSLDEWNELQSKLSLMTDRERDNYFQNAWSNREDLIRNVRKKAKDGLI